MRVLVTGAGGFIGQACTAGFVAQGWHVRAVSRSSSPEISGCEWLTIGALADVEWSEYLKDVDCVLHLAGVAHRFSALEDEFMKINVDETLRLAQEAIEAGVRRFILMSSVAVYGRCQGDVLLDENSDILPQDANGRTKILAERRLQETCRQSGMDWTIIRPPLVYGPGAPGNFRRLVKVIRKGIPLPLLAANAPRSYVGLDNLVSAILCVANSPKAANRIYLVTDGEDISTADFIRLIAKSLGQASRLWWLPEGLLRFGATLLGRASDAERLFGRLQLNGNAIRNELDWSPVLTVREGIERAVVSENISVVKSLGYSPHRLGK